LPIDSSQLLATIERPQGPARGPTARNFVTYPLPGIDRQGSRTTHPSYQRYDFNVRLLIVEDEPKSAAYLRKGLSEHGYVADVASNSEDGLYLAQNSDYDLLILDVMLPRRDGWSILSDLTPCTKPAHNQRCYTGNYFQTISDSLRRIRPKLQGRLNSALGGETGHFASGQPQSDGVVVDSELPLAVELQFSVHQDGFDDFYFLESGSPQTKPVEFCCGNTSFCRRFAALCTENERKR
jgi:hypothetical protein